MTYPLTTRSHSTGDIPLEFTKAAQQTVTDAHSHAAMHAHGHAHGHHRNRDANARRLAITLGLVLLYMVAEIVGGWLSNSLALLADAGHMFSDAAALGLSLFAAWIARRPPTPQRSYGYYRAEILAALANGAALGAISLVVLVEAYRRLWTTPEVSGQLMLAVATGGVVVNIAGLWLLYAGRATSLNVHGAWLHVLADLLGSLAAVVGGALVWAFGWNWADPVASALISLLIIYSSWELLKDSIAILMEGTPGHVDLDAVRGAMREVRGVSDVHDLHVWTITSGLEALSGHVVTVDDRASHKLLAEMRELLHSRFGIDHITIQIEPPEFDNCQTRC
jgi:cobalt-zinc-cadmium efflux system protein